MTLPSSNHLNDDWWDELKETDGEKDMEAHYTNAKPFGKTLPRKEKDPGSFTLPCFIKNMCYKVLADLGGSSTELNLEARLMGNVLRKNRPYDPKFEDYIELRDLNEPLELRHDQVVDLGPTIEEGEAIDTPIKEMVKTRHDDDKTTNRIKDYPSVSNLDRKIHVNDAYNLRMSKRFYNSIMKDKLEFKGKSIVGAFMNAPIFVGTFSVVIDFAVIEDMDHYHDEEMGDVIVGREFCKEIGINAKRFEGMITIHNGNEEVTYQMNGVNILKSIDEGLFQMGMIRETLAEGEEGALHLGPKRPQVYFDLSPEDKE
nr:hypothetical protein [Tanacetum cinerariifolium]